MYFQTLIISVLIYAYLLILQGMCREILCSPGRIYADAIARVHSCRGPLKSFMDLQLRSRSKISCHQMSFNSLNL